ncbi:MAG TPA: spore coat U domain-containing protein [Gammaproteobacteria bacterium]|nr:spore coat U domain-containing protein [Gammaproteobacteria bacterium]
MKRFLSFLVFGLICIYLCVLPGYAGIATYNLSVTATVVGNCTISTTPVAFGNYDPIVANATNPLEATGTVVVTCTKNTPVTNLWVSLGQGLHFSTNTTHMQGATSSDLLSYTLYQPPSNTAGAACASPFSSRPIWGNGTPGPGTYGNALALTSPLSKTARTYNVCGSIPGGQDMSVDSYSDTVVATVNF